MASQPLRPFPEPRDPSAYRPSGSNGKAVAAMICGIVGLLVAGVILGILAIVLGSIAKGEIDRTGQDGRGMATAGIILGIIDLVLGVVFIAVFFG